MENNCAQFTGTLLEFLDETFTTTHGHFLDKGTSLFPTLEGVTAEEASRKLSTNNATIAAHVEHVRFYLDVLNDIMKSGEIVKVDWREIWSSVSSVNSDEWESLRERLHNSYRSVMTTVNSFNDWNGENDFAGILSIVVHSAYHLGAIRQALAALRAR